MSFGIIILSKLLRKFPLDILKDISDLIVDVNTYLKAKNFKAITVSRKHL